MTFQTITITREGVEDIPVNVQIDNSDPECHKANPSGLVLSDVLAFSPDGEPAPVLFKQGQWIDLTDEEQDIAKKQSEMDQFNKLTDRQQRAQESHNYRERMGYE